MYTNTAFTFEDTSSSTATAYLPSTPAASTAALFSRSITFDGNPSTVISRPPLASADVSRTEFFSNIYTNPIIGNTQPSIIEPILLPLARGRVEQFTTFATDYVNSTNSVRGARGVENKYAVAVEDDVSSKVNVPKSNIDLNQDKYYRLFSKYALMEPNITVESCEPKFRYADFIQATDFLFEKYKLPDLKLVAKYYNLHVSGNKPVLIERIRTYFCQTKSAITIQRVFRGHLIRFCRKLQGPALFRRELCVNETDFYTLEPLNEISHTMFFSYIDDQQYIYGFDISSIISLISKNNNPINPYNRAAFPYKATVALHGLYNITKIIFPEIWNNNPSSIQTYMNKQVTYNTNSRANSAAGSPATPNSSVSLPVAPGNADGVIARRTHIEYQREITRILDTIRARPLDTRVRELFMEVNLLGNYAESSWFMDLDRIQLARFYQSYYDWWHMRSRLTPEMKQNICVFEDPFADVHLLYLYPTTTIEEYREACVRLMENMVYGSTDTNFRTIGALQMLRILTMISIPARTSMHWLYESLFA